MVIALSKDAADWQAARVADDAISVADHFPPPRQEVLGWVSDESVAIHYFPLVVWLAYEGGWWAGVPGNYLDLDRLKWTVTHWKLIR